MRNIVRRRGAQRPIVSDVELYDDFDVVEYLFTLLDDCFRYDFDGESLDTLRDYKLNLGDILRGFRSGSVSISREDEDALRYVQGQLNLLLSAIQQSVNKYGADIKAYLNGIF